MADYRVASWDDCNACGKNVVTVRTVATSHRVPTTHVSFDCPRCGASGTVGVVTTSRSKGAAVYSPLLTPPWVWALVAWNTLRGD
ncbi:MAG: hypothetical protein RL653_4140 [Pseudomonadota bacterium]